MSYKLIVSYTNWGNYKSIMYKSKYFFFKNRKLDDLAWIAVFKELDVSQDEFLHGLRCVRVESHDIQHHGVVWIRNGEVIAGHAADN